MCLNLMNKLYENFIFENTLNLFDVLTNNWVWTTAVRQLYEQMKLRDFQAAMRGKFSIFY